MACRPLRTLSLAIAAVAVATAAGAAELRDAQRGRALYENHCVVCHTAKVHGRTNRVPITLPELRGIVDLWQRDQGLRWSAQDIDDVTEYLNRTRYRYTK